MSGQGRAERNEEAFYQLVAEVHGKAASVSLDSLPHGGYAARVWDQRRPTVGDPKIVHACKYKDVDRRVDAGSWVSEDANAMAEQGWELVSFAVVQHAGGDGTHLPGAAVWAIYRRSA